MSLKNSNSISNNNSDYNNSDDNDDLVYIDIEDEIFNFSESGAEEEEEKQIEKNENFHSSNKRKLQEIDQNSDESAIKRAKYVTNFNEILAVSTKKYY